MQAMSRGRAASARREKTSDALISAAEQLFGRRGIDAVSLREIAAEAGHGNINAVQYHFGDKHGLIRAIYQRNIPFLERHRSEGLVLLRARGQLDSAQPLVDCMFRPLVELVDDDGRHSYAAFHFQALISPVWARSWNEIGDEAPVTRLLAAMISALEPAVPQFLHSRRMIQATLAVLLTIVETDRLTAEGASADHIAALREDVFATAARICVSAPRV